MVLILLFLEKFQAVRISVRKDQWGTFASDLCEYSEEEIIRITHLAFRTALKKKKKSHFGR
jgi:isocitrate/isopropylmalate dehydrogenase